MDGQVWWMRTDPVRRMAPQELEYGARAPSYSPTPSVCRLGMQARRSKPARRERRSRGACGVGRSDNEVVPDP